MAVYADMTKHLLHDLLSRNVKVVHPDMRTTEPARRMRNGDSGLWPVGASGRMIATQSNHRMTIRARAVMFEYAIKCVGERQRRRQAASTFLPAPELACQAR